MVQFSNWSLTNILEKSKEILFAHYNPHVWGDCNEINSTLAVVLESLGFSVEVHTGYVNLDIPLDADEEELEDVYDPSHLWLKVNGETIDLAAAQFEGHVHGEIDYQSKLIISAVQFSNSELAEQILAKVLD